MAKEVRGDPVELGVVGKAFTTAGTGLRTGLKDMREDGLIPANAFGNTPGAESFNESYSDVLEKAGQAMEDLADTAERDSDCVYRVAFAYQKLDQDHEAKIKAERDALVEKEKLNRLREEIGSVPYPSKKPVVV